MGSAGNRARDRVNEASGHAYVILLRRFRCPQEKFPLILQKNLQKNCFVCYLLVQPGIEDCFGRTKRNQAQIMCLHLLVNSEETRKLLRIYWVSSRKPLPLGVIVEYRSTPSTTAGEYAQTNDEAGSSLCICICITGITVEKRLTGDTTCLNSPPQLIPSPLK